MLKFNDFGRVEELATPFWYYDMDVFRKTVKLAASLSERYGIGAHYALKANVEPRLVSYIASKGFGADCVSGNEVKYAVESGFARSSIVFAGVGKSDKEISDALDLGIGCFNVESLMEMQVIDALAASKGVRANVSLRINPNIDAHTHRYVTTGLYENKFGISRHEFEAAIDILKGSKALDFKGLHFHIGSQITDVEPVYSLECERAAEIVEWFEAHGMEVGSIDLGGGLGSRLGLLLGVESLLELRDLLVGGLLRLVGLVECACRALVGLGLLLPLAGVRLLGLVERLVVGLLAPGRLRTARGLRVGLCCHVASFPGPCGPSGQPCGRAP